MMRYRKLAILLVFSSLFAAVVFWNYRDNEWGAAMPLTATITSGDYTEEITCWEDYWGNYCFFFPSYADPSGIQIRSDSGDEIWIADHMITAKGVSGNQFQMNTEYGLARFGFWNQFDGVLQILKSENVPTLYIDVGSGSMDYIHQEKGNEESGTMRLYTVDGALCSSGSVESIKGRGNGTWGWWKKSYSLTLSEAADLLGLGHAQRWILLSNGYDCSHLRNKMAYDLADSVGMAYSPGYRWVDVYLNGEYSGLYLLCERNEVHPERVNISPDNGFLVSRESEGRLIAQNYPYVGLKLGAFRIHHSSLSEDQMEAMWKSVESALLAEDGIDPRTGKCWTELIDLDSWVEKYLIDEIAANYDGGGISQFFYYDGEDSSGKIYAGPVWDMDVTFGADSWEGSWNTSPPNNFVAKRPRYLDDTNYSPFWLLSQKEEFCQRTVEIYEKNFRPALMELIDSGFDYYIQEIAWAAEVNQIRWMTGYPEKESEKIRTFLSERVAFLDAVWLREETFCDVLLIDDVGISEKHVVAWFAVRPGEYLPEIPTSENSAWYVCGTDEPFDVTQPVYASVKIYRKEQPVPQVSSVEKTELVYFAVLMMLLAVFLVIDRMRTSKKGIRYKQHA